MPLLAVLLLVVATPAVVWYLVGDLSTDPEHLAGPSTVLTQTIGIAGIVVFCCGVVLLILRKPASHHVVFLALLLPAGALAAFTERVTTARVIGANIGGGLATLVLLPLAGLLVLAAIGYGVVQLRRRPGR